MAVGAAIDDVQLAGLAIAEHQDRLIGQVHAHHRVAHRERLDLGGGFRDDGRVQRLGLGREFGFRIGGLGQHILAAGLRLGAVIEIARMRRDPAAIAAQAGGDMLRRVIEGGMCVACLTFAAHGDAAAGMDIDITGEKAARLAESDMRFQGMVEIFGGDDVEMLRHMDAQGVGEFDLFARDRELHGSSPELLGSGSKTPAKRASGGHFFPLALR